MRFSVEDKIVQTYHIWFTENEVEVLQRFCQPEAFHTVILLWWCLRDVSNCSIGKLRLSMGADCLEHLPCNILILRLARDSVHIKYRLDRFGPENVPSVTNLAEWT